GGSLAGTYTGNPTLSGNPIFSGTPDVTGTLRFKGPAPYVDIMESTYGAVCDGVTDDTTAINAAITVAAANGGTVKFPVCRVCVAASQILQDNLTKVTFAGDISDSWIGNVASRGQLKLTTATSPALRLRNAFGVTIKGMNIQCSNASMTGTCISFDA